MIIAEIEKNMKEKIRVSVENFKNHRFIDCRVYWEDDKGETRPSKKGIALNDETIREEQRMDTTKKNDRIKETLFHEEMILTIGEIESLCGQIIKTLEEKVFRAKGIKEAITIESLKPVELDFIQLMGCIKENTEYMQSLMNDTQGYER